MNTLPKIALGAWAWGNDGTFGGNLTADALRPIFEAGMADGVRRSLMKQRCPLNVKWTATMNWSILIISYAGFWRHTRTRAC